MQPIHRNVQFFSILHVMSVSKTKLKPHKSVNAALTEIAVKNAPKEISHTISLGSQKRKGGKFFAFQARRSQENWND